MIKNHRPFRSWMVSAAWCCMVNGLHADGGNTHGVAEAIDQPSIAITDGGDYPWFSTDSPTHDGIDAAQCGVPSALENATSSFSTTVTGPGTVSFWWKVLTGFYYRDPVVYSMVWWDFATLRFSVDGGHQAGLGSLMYQGETPWVQQTVTLGAGTHVLTWTYDPWGLMGHRPMSGPAIGAAWVDQFVMAVPSTPRQMFDSWAFDAGLTGQVAEALATPHQDGVGNLLKYANHLNGNGPDVRVLIPNTGTAGLPCIYLDRGGPQPVLRIEYLRRKGSGLTYTPPKSSDLAIWLPLTATPMPPIDIDAAWERVVIAEPCDLASKPKLFGRVDVVMPP